MRNKLFASAHGVISLSWYIAVLFLFVAAAANGTLSASTTPQISAGLQTSPPPPSLSLRGTDGCPPLAGAGGGFPGGCPEHFDSVSRIEPATGKSVGWVERSETQQSNLRLGIQNLSSTSIGNPQLDKAAFAQKTKKLQIPFIANNGQVDDRVKFYANTFGGTVFVTKDGEIVYSLPKSDNSGDRSKNTDVRTQNPEDRSKIQDNRASCILDLASDTNGASGIVHPASYIVGRDSKSEFQNLSSTSIGDLKSGVAIKETLVGGRVYEITGNEKAVTKVNYFKGNDPEKWKTDISTYDFVNLGEIYKGIELRLKVYGDNVEKLFCVKPGADPEQIKISLSGIQPPESPLEKGARGLWVNEHGELVAETELGPVKFTKPVAYQEIDGKRVEVDVEYSISTTKSAIVRLSAHDEVQNRKSKIVNHKCTYGFRVASYDKSHDLIIDPLLASTYLGGSSDDYGTSLALGTSGHVYVTGYTFSSTFPTTTGAYNASQNGSYDVFVSKLNGSLTTLLASTYLGGSNADYGTSLALDISENVCLTGYTFSTNFPTTIGAYDQFNYPFTTDVFVSKLNVNGSATSLLASTYLGGSNDDRGNSLVLDTSGNIYVTGWTDSSNFPTTIGAYDTSQNGSSTDVFVSKLNGNVTSLLASTYLGGSSRDEGFSLALGTTSGHVYLTGHTMSLNFPTIGAYDPSQNGSFDVFVSKLDDGLTSLLASTYLGGSGDDIGKSLALDTSGNVYVTGNTGSSNFPIPIVGDVPYDYSPNGGSDVFVSKLNGGLANLLASTYLGGGGDDEGSSLALDTSGHVYVTGHTSSANFPTGIVMPYDDSPNGGSDVFVSKLNGGLANLLASTYLGGDGDDEGSSLALDPSGHVYVAGWTSSANFPTTGVEYDTSYNSFQDAFISKFDGNLSASGTSTTTQACVQPPSDMVAWWRAESDANDFVGTNNGTMVNGATFATGMVGQAFSFDGVDDFVRIPDSSSLDITGPLTIDAWIFLPDVIGNHEIVSKLDNTTGNEQVAYELVTIDNGLQGAVYDNSENKVRGKRVFGPLTVGWNHVAMTYDGGTTDSSVRVYVNGNRVDTDGVDDLTLLVCGQCGGTFVAIENVASDVMIGASTKPDGQVGNFFDGLIDEAEIFNSALSASEIAAIYNAGSAGKCKPTPTLSPTATSSPTPTPTPTPTQACVQPPSDMVGWWPMDETQGSTAYDFAGTFQNNGTWKNNPVPVTGMVGGALSFDGSSYVEVGPAQAEINFQKNEDFSIDVWVKTTDSQSTRTLVDKRKQIGNGKLRGYHLYLYKGKPGLQLADGGSGSGYNNYNSTAPTAFVADGTWHHIAVTVERNNASGLNIYVDGANVASHNPTARAGNLTNKAPLVFGGKNLINSKFTFVGTLDELEIFNRALTQTEIQDIYNAGSAGKCKPTPTPSPTATSSPIPTLTISPVPTVIGTGTVFGWVEDADEEPLEGVMVAINEKGQLKQKSLTDEDGYYEFGGLPKGKYTITYEKEGYQTQTQDISLNEGEEKDLDITTMEQIETGEIFGNVVDIKGNPLESVSLELKGKKTKVKQTASSDEGGYFEFVDLEADTYNIVAKKPKYRKTQQKVKLGEGESKEIEIVMKRPGKTKYEP